jgi:hypothetical protein
MGAKSYRLERQGEQSRPATSERGHHQIAAFRATASNKRKSVKQ